MREIGLQSIFLFPLSGRPRTSPPILWRSRKRRDALRQFHLFAFLFLVGVVNNGVYAQGNLRFNPQSADFGDVEVGSRKKIDVEVTNDGITNRVITNESLRSDMFTVAGIRPPMSIAPGAHIVVSIEFEPTRPGTAVAYALIENHRIRGQDVLAAYSLRGNGVAAAHLEAMPQKIAFANVPTGTSISQWVQLRNNGRKAITISSVHVAGSSFATRELATPLTLTAGKTKGFELRFSPAGIGKHDGTVTFESWSGVKELTITASGAGIKATGSISASPGIVTFGDARVGGMEKLAVTLKNRGNSNLVISDVSVAGIDVSVGGYLRHATIAPGQTATLDLVFAPKKAGAMTGHVKITSNADDSPTIVALSGKGVSSSGHSVGLSWEASGSSGVIGYNVYRVALPGKMYLRLSHTPVSGLAFTDGTVETGKTYSYVVTAVNWDGEESLYSQPVTATVP